MMDSEQIELEATKETEEFQKLKVGKVYTLKDIVSLEQYGIIDRLSFPMENKICYKQGNDIYYLQKKEDGLFEVVHCR
jgi:hypothetical protein